MTTTGGETVLVIGGGHPQLCLIEALRELGAHVVAVDDRPGVPAHRVAHEVVPIHRYDREAISAYAQKHRPDYVASGGADKAVHIAAELAETLRLPSPVSSATAAIPMSKTTSRQRLAAAGVPVPATVHGSAMGVFLALDWGQVTFPVVVKPDQGIGQTGVNRAETVTQALASIEAAITVSGNGIAVMQELIQGDEIGVNGLVIAGQFHLLTTSYRRSSRDRGGEFGVAMDKVYPAITDTTTLYALAAIIQRACDALGIVNSPVYAQAIMRSAPRRGTTFTLIEIMPRLGGGEDPRLVHAATGINLARGAALMWTGRPVAFDDLRDGLPHRAVVLRFLWARPGRVTAVVGLSEARRISGVVAAEVFVHRGQELAALSSSRERAGYVLAAGSDLESTVVVADKTQAAVTITTEAGSDA